ncbi:hypothetical protein I79_023610 [Cricetulus griseus]|uniref:Uncharacterized protein n=1 Tax=Cricetulus griseus TaxID=10029 RepID=G3IIE2_CRIGR|nr:hypothetical protein I79_023610 [Cricetulus griseus]
MSHKKPRQSLIALVLPNSPVCPKVQITIPTNFPQVQGLSSKLQDRVEGQSSKVCGQALVVHTFNPSTREAEAGRSQ